MQRQIQILILLLSILAALPIRVAAQPELPRVRLIATGGTIANRAGSRLTAGELLQSTPTLDRYVRAEAEQFTNVGSAALTLHQWLLLARRINDLLRQRADLAGIVITSGTDMLEEVAYFLHLTVKSDRPVVLVGSMRAPSAADSDGPSNLLQAFRVAADSRSRGLGVLVVLNGEINSARDVTKTDTVQLDSFRSLGHGPLGTIDAERVAYARRVPRRHTLDSEFDVRRIQTLPRVDILMAYQEAPSDLIRAALDGGARGLVIAGAGAGTVAASQRDGLDYAARRHVVVVIASRVPAGRVNGPIDGGRAHPGVDTVFADDLPPVKARILLMLALSRKAGAADIQRMFTEY